MDEALGTALGLVKVVICEGFLMKIRMEIDITRLSKKVLLLSTLILLILSW